MDKETFERQKAFAGEKKPSMLRRRVGHDYTERQIYMVTMTTEGRRPLFGQVVGRSDAPAGDNNAPRIVLSELGTRVQQEWLGIPNYYPEIKIIALQMMPDHLHGILFVKQKMQKDLSRVIRGFKTGCNRAYRALFSASPAVPCVATQSQQRAPSNPKGSHPKHGLLFAPGFNDQLLLSQGQLQTWLDYLRDNPRRLLMKREHPDLFRVQRNLIIKGQQFSAIGNRFLLNRPIRQQVQCSRRLTEEQIAEKTEEMLSLARQRAAFDAGMPLIILQENGFTDLAKPGGQRMDACARGQLLLLAPWEHHNERTAITRNQCLTLNALAHQICE